MRQVPGTFSLHGGQIELPEDFGFTEAIPHYLIMAVVSKKCSAPPSSLLMAQSLE
jgi:hypothetical protein